MRPAAIHEACCVAAIPTVERPSLRGGATHPAAISSQAASDRYVGVIQTCWARRSLWYSRFRKWRPVAPPAAPSQAAVQAVACTYTHKMAASGAGTDDKSTGGGGDAAQEREAMQNMNSGAAEVEIDEEKVMGELQELLKDVNATEAER